MSTVWAVPASVALQRRHILGFLRDARCSVRAVEVKLFKGDPLLNRRPFGSRRWALRGNLAKTAKEITEYVAHNDPSRATITAADEV